jgi:uncharacterized protein YjbI with pentapeptide repeats
MVVALWAIFGPLVTLTGGADLRQLTAQDRLAARSGIQTLFGTVLGFLVAAGGFYYTVRKYFLDRDKQHVDRFSTAVEHLSSDQETLRAGGVRALDSILHNSPAHRNLVLKSLTGFLRHHTSHGGNADRDDVTAAIDALRDRGTSRARRPDRPLDLHGVRLPHADLRDIDLAGANLTDAEFTGADLTGADLSHARLNHADLTRADLTDATLVGADLTNARLAEATLTTANRTDAIVTGTILAQPGSPP